MKLNKAPVGGNPKCIVKLCSEIYFSINQCGICVECVGVEIVRRWKVNIFYKVGRKQRSAIKHGMDHRRVCPTLANK